MNVVDLHPDDLLDKDAHGDLSDGERARLEAHLERCETCRFEREVRADFADELGDDEEEIPSQRLLTLLDGIPPSIAPPAQVDEVVAGPSKLDPLTKTATDDANDDEAALVAARVSTRPARIRRNMRVLLLVAAALLVGSAATAGIGGTRVWAHVAAALSLDTQTEDDPPAVAAPSATATHKRVPATVAPPVPTELVVSPPSSAAEKGPETPAFSAPVETPASLFEAANHARNAGDYGRAVSLHRKLETTYPTSREAHASYATLGRLLLDRGDPSSALTAFDGYQAKGPGPMDEAVLVGRATALERLGRDAEARTAWTTLLRDFPDTPYREHAESRLKGSPR